MAMGLGEWLVRLVCSFSLRCSAQGANTSHIPVVRVRVQLEVQTYCYSTKCFPVHVSIFIIVPKANSILLKREAFLSHLEKR